MVQEEFENTKGVIRIRKSKKWFIKLFEEGIFLKIYFSEFRQTIRTL